MIMSAGEPQNCMIPVPNRRRDVFLLVDIDGWIVIFVNPCLVIATVTPNSSAMEIPVFYKIGIDVGVIARWISLIPITCMLMTNDDELMLHVEHTASDVGPTPDSAACRQASHPPHLPLTSLPGRAVVEYVVMDIGSIHVSSSI